MRRPKRLSTIAHTDHTLMSPVGAALLARLIALFDLPPGARVLDLCCGKAEVLLRTLAVWPGATGVGVDLNAAFLADAAAAAAQRGLAERVALIEGDAWRDPRVGDGYDAVVCLGGAWPGDDRTALYAGLAERVRPGGVVLVGEGFFTRSPDRHDLVADGWDPEDTPRLADAVALGAAAGLTALYTAAATPADWDEYEGLYLRAVERHVHTHPDDPEADDMVHFIRWWHRRYLEWRRDHLGFGLHLFMR